MKDSLKHVESEELTTGCQELITSKLLLSPCTSTTSFATTSSEGCNNDENFPFILLLPSAATSNKGHRGKQAHPMANRVVNKYILQPRYNKPRPKPRHKDARLHKKKPTSVKTKVPNTTTRVLLSSYNNKKEEWMKFHADNRDDDASQLCCTSTPIRHCRRSSQPEHHHDMRNTTSRNSSNSALPKNIAFLVRRSTPPTLGEDQSFVTPKKKMMKKENDDVLVDLCSTSECLPPLLPLLLWSKINQSWAISTASCHVWKAVTQALWHAKRNVTCKTNGKREDDELLFSVLAARCLLVVG